MADHTPMGRAPGRPPQVDSVSHRIITSGPGGLPGPVPPKYYGRFVAAIACTAFMVCFGVPSRFCGFDLHDDRVAGGSTARQLDLARSSMGVSALPALRAVVPLDNICGALGFSDRVEQPEGVRMILRGTEWGAKRGCQCQISFGMLPGRATLQSLHDRIDGG